MTTLKLIKGARRELEYQLLHAMFTPGGNITAEALRQRLTPRASGQLRAVGATASPPHDKPPPAAEPVDDQT